VQVQEVNRLLAQFEQMQKMMKMMRGGNLGKMLRNMKGMFPGGGEARDSRGAGRLRALGVPRRSRSGRPDRPSSHRCDPTRASAPAQIPLAPFGWFARPRPGSCWKGEYPDKVSSDTQCYLPSTSSLIRGSIKGR
jgi:hypothetical protein